MKTATKFDYYNFDRICSYDAPYSFILGARGLGKTYGAKKRVILNAIRKGEQFIYLRRYKTEIKGRASFFADIFHEFPDWKFRVAGNTAQMQRSDKGEKDPWLTIGYFAALSTAQSYKSVAYPKVTTIIFDEFIIEKGSVTYLPDEANLFNDFYSTVDRYKDKTKVFFLANAISIMNPYFIEYGIRTTDGEWVRKADGFIAVHFADSAEFGSQVKKTRFGKFIESTDYGSYSIDSNFKDDGDNLVENKTPEAKYFLTIETRGGTFSVWNDMSSREPVYYVQSKLPKEQINFTIIPQHVGGEMKLLVYSDKILQYLRSAYKNGNVRFDSATARNAFIELFKR